MRLVGDIVTVLYTTLHVPCTYLAFGSYKSQAAGAYSIFPASQVCIYQCYIASCLKAPCLRKTHMGGWESLGHACHTSPPPSCVHPACIAGMDYRNGGP